MEQELEKPDLQAWIYVWKCRWELLPSMQILENEWVKLPRKGKS